MIACPMKGCLLKRLRVRIPTFLVVALTVGTALLVPATAAHAAFQADRSRASFTYTKTNFATYDLGTVHGLASGTLDDTGPTRVFHGSVTDAVPTDGKCVRFQIFGQSGGQISETACGGGTISFTVATSDENLTVVLHDLKADGTNSNTGAWMYLWSTTQYPKEGVAGTSASYSYDGPRNVVFSMHAYNFAVTGSGFTSISNPDVLFLFVTVTATGVGCVSSGFNPNYQDVCPPNSMHSSYMANSGGAIFVAASDGALLDVAIQTLV